MTFVVEKRGTGTDFSSEYFFSVIIPPMLYTHLYLHIAHTRRTNGRSLGTFLNSNKVKIKCTLVQALRLCTGRTDHRRRRGIALLFIDHGNRRG